MSGLTIGLLSLDVLRMDVVMKSTVPFHYYDDPHINLRW